MILLVRISSNLKEIRRQNKIQERHVNDVPHISLGDEKNESRKENLKNSW